MFGFGKKKVDPNSPEELAKKFSAAVKAAEGHLNFPDLTGYFSDNDRLNKFIDRLRSGTDEDLVKALASLGKDSNDRQKMVKIKLASIAIQKIYA